MLIDLEGRVHNYELAYAKALFPVFEAVINSIHAIQEARDARLLASPASGHITIRLEREPSPRMKSDSGDTIGLSAIDNIVVEDDGIGFTKTNFESFNTSDTTKKRKIGGRGIGRFTWLKAFDRAEVRSVFADGEGFNVVSFGFVLPHGVDASVVMRAEQDEPRLTKVRLVAARPRYANEIPKRADVIARRIIEHCLDYFVVGEAPQIVIEDPGHDAIDLNELYASEVQGSSASETFDVAGNSLHATHVLIAARGGIGHRLHFCANRRVVRSEPLDRFLVDLDEPVQQGDAPPGSRGYFYAGYISGRYLVRPCQIRRLICCSSWIRLK